MPGRPANAVLALILAAEYERAVNAYRAIPDPRPEDDRWGGYAIFAAHDALEARDVLARAVGRGESPARIELATVERHLGHLEAAETLLAALDLDRLSAFDAALAERELAAVALTKGDYLGAIRHLESAWTAASGGPWSSALRPQVAQLLGFVLSQQGLDRQAVHYLDQAVKLAQPGRRAYPLLARALAHVYDANFENSERDLNLMASLAPLSPNVEALKTFVLGELRRAQGRWNEAKTALEKAARQARAAADPQAQGHALLALSGVLCALGELNEARAAISRAEPLAGDDRDRAFVRLRLGAWKLEAAAGGDALEAPVLRREGEADLQAALEAFNKLGAGREAAWCLVQLTRASLEDGNAAEAKKRLTDAVNRALGLGGTGTLISELRLAPPVTDFALRQPPDAYLHWALNRWRANFGVAPSVVRLSTFGTPSLLVDDRPVRLALRRAMELLAFVLTHPDLTLEQLLAALWPDDLPKRATTYFHQVRHQLTKAVPGLSIHFDANTRTYRVETSGFELACDLVEVKRHLSAGTEDGVQAALELYRGPFLADADSEWARLERETMEWKMIRSGLTLIERWVKEGQFEKSLKLSERLLEIEPLNDALAEYLVTSTRELRGTLAARSVLDEISRRYRDEVGSVPDSLSHLGERLTEVN